MTRHECIHGNSLEVIPTLNASVDCVVADPPYGKMSTINCAVELCREVCTGPSFFFMYADDVFDLEKRPDQVLFWAKPVSTKNTTRKYSRFVEVIAVYDLDKSPFNQNTHWSTRTGVFTDSLISSLVHPFQKPVSLIEKLLVVNANSDALVLDPFAGSETVRKACEKLNMRSISIEITP